MYFRKEPSPEQIQQFIASQRDQPFTYRQVGATQANPPAGFRTDHNRISLGAGRDVYNHAVAALKAWKQFDLGWVEAVPDDTPLVIGMAVAIKAKTFGFWTLNACRIVYLIDEDGPVTKFGFAYGT